MGVDRYPNHRQTPRPTSGPGSWWKQADKDYVRKRYDRTIKHLSVKLGRTPWAVQMELLTGLLKVPDEVAKKARDTRHLERTSRAPRWMKTVWDVTNHQVIGGLVAGVLLSGFTAIAYRLLTG